MAPEMMKNSNYDSCVDWFSFGLVLFEMLSGRNPFKANATSSPNSDQLPTRVSSLLMKEGKLVQDDNTFGPEAADLLTKLLRYDVSTFEFSSYFSFMLA